MTEDSRELYLSFLFLVLLILVFISSANAVITGKLILRVYEDGVVAIEDRILPEVAHGNITVKLLTSRVENILVVGGDGELVNYQRNGDLVTLYGELPNQVIIHYETSALTIKNGSLWMLEIYLPRDAEVVMPSRSVILSLSDVPKMIAKEENSLKLLLSPGLWRIEYMIQFKPHTTIQEARDNSLVIIFSSIIGGPIIMISVIFYIRKKKNSSMVLNGDEKRIFELIKKRKRVTEAEIRALTHLPKTTVWRIVRRLERKGLVKVIKVNNKNEVELV
ncbi:MAG: winged helix-turn-helix transcriptional regulator [Candidatus Nezhaarchaeales archaeon]